MSRTQETTDNPRDDVEPWCMVKGCPRCRTTTVSFVNARDVTRGYCDIHINHLLQMNVGLVGTSGHPEG